MALADGVLPAAWSLGWLLACLAGVWVGRRQPATWPWIILLATKVVITAAFFGYARQGAAVVPAVLVLAALGVEAALGKRVGLTVPWRRGIVAACVVAAAVETGRWLQEPEIVIDGRPAGAVDPVPADLHRDHQIEVR
jgi:hypothetical protein